MNNEKYIIKLLKQIENFNEKSSILPKLKEKQKITPPLENQINSNLNKKKN